MLTGAGTRNAARAAPLGLALEASDSSRDRVCACRTQATPCSRVTGRRIPRPGVAGSHPAGGTL